jgi:hypothetical protein
LRIKYCSAPCGSGKTKKIVERACELQARAGPTPVRVFHRGAIGGDAKLSKALADYIQNPPDTPEIVFATHQVLPHIKHFATKGEWHLLVDEGLQAVRYQQHRIPRTHKLITDHLDVSQVSAIYGRVSVRGIGLHEIAQNQDQDEILETLTDTSQILANRLGEGKVLAFHSVLKPEILHGFAEVFMAGANFEDSAIFSVWGEQGVRFEPDREFVKGLRYSKHQNGELVTIYYITEQQWSRKRREATCGEDGATLTL